MQPDKHMLQRDMEKSSKPADSVGTARYWNAKILADVTQKNQEYQRKKEKESSERIRDAAERSTYKRTHSSSKGKTLYFFT
jgi:hypothetical protein